MSDEEREELRREIKIGTANLKALFEFLLEKGLACKTNDGKIVINDFLSDKVYEASKEFVEKREKEKNKAGAITAITHKTKRMVLESTNIGKDMRKRDCLPKFYDRNGHEVKTGEKNHKTVHAIVKLELDKEVLTSQGVDIPSLTRISLFDMVVLNHAVSLYLAGNEYFTAEMLYRQMTGNRGARLTDKMRERIYQSFKVLRVTGISISSQQEESAGLNPKRAYHGVLLPSEIITEQKVTLQGQSVQDCIHMFRNSPLWDYAQSKRQVTPLPVEMLYASRKDDSKDGKRSIRNSEENIIIKDYLLRRYADMFEDNKRVKPKLPRVIRYDKVYELFELDENSSGIRTVKARIRGIVRAILAEWTEAKFLKGYQELTEDNQKPRNGIATAKVRVDFYTPKEFEKIHKSDIYLHD